MSDICKKALPDGPEWTFDLLDRYQASIDAGVR